MGSDQRAERAQRELADLAGGGLDLDLFQSAVAEVVGRVVPHDASCWAPIDPRSGMITGQVTLHFDPSPEMQRRFAEVEAEGTDVHTFGSLAGSARPVARLSDAGGAALRASPRLAEIYRPLGFGPELRAAFATDDRCWGVAGLLRAGGTTDFTDAEVELLGRLGPTIARGLRAATLRHRLADPGEAAPAVLVLGPDDTVVAATPAATERLAGLGRGPQSGLAPAVVSVVTAVRTQGVDHARARLRGAEGTWLTMSASPMTSATGEAQVVVTIEPASPAEISDLRLAAHGLSGREIELCREVLAGRSTAEIAERLYISANTVQDHLKSVFDKTGVRSRRALVALLGSTTS